MKLPKLLSLSRATLHAVALAVFTAASTQAAMISWSAPLNITGDSDVSTNGTLLGAVGLSPGFGTYTATVNGVTFTGVEAFFTSSSGPFSWTTISGGFHNSNATTPISTDYQRLLLAGANNSPFTLTISGLTQGSSYEFEFWSNSTSQSTTVTATAGNSIVLDSNPTPSIAGLGQFAIGTFTADALTQQIAFTGFTRVNGFQVRELSAIPEPTTALFGAALLGVVGLTRGRATKRAKA